ncbi:retrotransposon protein, putative, ty1-copia subclass [Tanacetum coccineum]
MEFMKRKYKTEDAGTTEIRGSSVFGLQVVIQRARGRLGSSSASFALDIHAEGMTLIGQQAGSDRLLFTMIQPRLNMVEHVGHLQVLTTVVGWIDTGGNRIVCADKVCLTLSEPVDNGTEAGLWATLQLLISREVNKWLHSPQLCGNMELDTSHAPITCAKYGIADKKVNRTLKEMVTAMLISSGMSQDMWGEAILTATYLLNKIPRKEKEETPYELWMGRKPSYQYLRVWGCLAKVAVPTPKAQKIGPKSVDCIFIGYAKNSTAYRFIVHDSKNPDIQKNTIMESRNASFFENIFPCLSNGTGSSNLDLDDKVLENKRTKR